MPGEVRVRWLGVAGLELRLNDEVLLVDPFFTRPPFSHLWLNRVEPDHALIAEKISRCDHILVTHAHYDHLMDVPDIVANTGAVAWGSCNTCRLLAACHVQPERVREVRVGDQLRLGSFQVQVLAAPPGREAPGFAPGPLSPTLRPPLRLHDYRMDTSFHYLIQAGSLRLLDLSGRSAWTAPQADILFVIPVGTRARFQSLLAAVRPRVVIPIHWDDFFRPLAKPIRPSLEPPHLAFPPLKRMDLAGFKQLVEQMAPGTRAIVPEAFRVYEL